MRITVVMTDEDGVVFDTYCKKNGFKKSTLINRLIREHMVNSGFHLQTELFDKQVLKGQIDDK